MSEACLRTPMEPQVVVAAALCAPRLYVRGGRSDGRPAVRAFLRVFETGSERYRTADDHRFVPPAPNGRADPGPYGGRGRTAAPW